MTKDWDDIDLLDDDICPVCGFDSCVPAMGRASSKVLLIGDAPGKRELETGRPYTGRTGTILNTELRKFGFSLRSFRLCNLWLHTKLKKKDANYGGCFEYGLQKVLAEAKDKELILLIGADTTRYFTDKPVTSVNGLFVTSNYLSAPHIIAMLQPTTVFHASVLGEIRFALKNFTEKVKEIYE